MMGPCRHGYVANISEVSRSNGATAPHGCLSCQAEATKEDIRRILAELKQVRQDLGQATCQAAEGFAAVQTLHTTVDRGVQGLWRELAAVQAQLRDLRERPLVRAPAWLTRLLARA